MLSPKSRTCNPLSAAAGIHLFPCNRAVVSAVFSLAFRTSRPAASPAIDAWSPLAFAHRRWRQRAQACGDPPARFGRIDDLVDLKQAAHVEGLALLVQCRDHRLVGRNSLLWVSNR